MLDGVIEYKTWAKYAQELGNIASKSEILHLALDNNAVESSELLIKVACVFSEINEHIQKIRYEFDDLDTITSKGAA